MDSASAARTPAARSGLGTTGSASFSADAGPDDAPATGVAFTADGKRLVSVGRDSEVRWWDAATGQLSQRSFGHEHPARTHRGEPRRRPGRQRRGRNPDHGLGCQDRQARAHLNRHRDFVNGLAFGGDGKLLASAGADARILVWDPRTGDVLRRPEWPYRRSQRGGLQPRQPCAGERRGRFRGAALGRGKRPADRLAGGPSSARENRCVQPKTENCSPARARTPGFCFGMSRRTRCINTLPSG